MLNKRAQNSINVTQPFLQAQNLLFLNIPESEFAKYLQEVHALVSREPLILAKIDADLDKIAKHKKKLRIFDARWEFSQSQSLPNIEIEYREITEAELRLQGGCPRMSPYLVYMFLMIRGYMGGVKSSEFKTFLMESISIQLLMGSVNNNKMPGFSTISENINGVSNETRQFIFDAQIRSIIEEQLDDFKDLTFDSTSVSGNSAWPTDSLILTGLVQRTFKRGKQLNKFGISDIADRRFPNILKNMRVLSKSISLTVRKPDSKAKRKKKYRKLLKEAKAAYKAFGSELEKVKKGLVHVNIEPSRYLKLERLICMMEEDLQGLLNVIGYCSKRINADESTPSKDKELSLSDKSAAFIKKGDREAVLGYKPQIGRSKDGFIPAFKVPLGNAADSKEFPNIVNDGIERTKVIPDSISTDDGYASKDVREKLLLRGVKVVSISGSKGKKLIGEEDWQTDEYVEARNDRSAVESLMFTIKHNFDFGRVMRRGIENVRAELLEKVLAYNFCRAIEVRKRKLLQELAA